MSDDAFRRELLRSPDGRLYEKAPPGVPAEEAARADLQQRLEAVTRVVLRPLASPLPLGFLALAAATLLVSGLQLGWLAPSQQRPVCWRAGRCWLPRRGRRSASSFRRWCC